MEGYLCGTGCRQEEYQSVQHGQNVWIHNADFQNGHGTWCPCVVHAKSELP